MVPKLPAGHRLVRFGSVDSTNSQAHRLAEIGERGPLWIWADRQTGGRGRLGRAWVSEPGNLYTTFLFTIAGPPQTGAQASFVAALAVRDAAASLIGEAAGLGLKWPNDVLLRGAKFCGILAETLAHPQATVLGLGIGLNLAHAPRGMAYPVTSLGAGIAPALALERLADALDRLLSVWNEGSGFAAIRQAWLDHAVGRDGEARAEVNGREVRGRFAGLAEDGALILIGADGIGRSIHAGEVRFAELERLRAQ